MVVVVVAIGEEFAMVLDEELVGESKSVVVIVVVVVESSRRGMRQQEIEHWYGVSIKLVAERIDVAC